MKKMIAVLLAVMMLTFCGMTAAEQEVRKMETEIGRASCRERV